MQAALLIGAMVLAQPQFNVRQGYVVRQAPAQAVVSAPRDVYGEALQEAARKNMPLVVGVHCDPPAGPWLTVRVNYDLQGVEGPVVLVSVPQQGDLVWIATLDEGVQSRMVAGLLNPSRQAVRAVRPAAMRVFQQAPRSANC
jgi:hypothetical protein